MASSWLEHESESELLGFTTQLSVGLTTSDDDRRAAAALIAHQHAGQPATSMPFAIQQHAARFSDEDFRNYLAVWDNIRDRVVAAASFLPPRRACSPTAFDLSAHFELRPLLQAFPARTMEVTTIAVDSSYRQDARALQLLVKGVAALMELNHVDRVLTSISVSRKHGDSYLHSLLERIRCANDGREALQLRPWLRLPAGEDIVIGTCRLPSAMKYLLRIGSYIHPEPAWDALNNTIVFATIIDRNRIDRGAWNKFRCA